MVETTDLSASLIGFARTLAAAPDSDGVLGEVCERVSGLLAVSVAIVVGEGADARVLSPDADAARLCAWEQQDGAGPGIDAAADGEPVAVASLGTDLRWPDYRARAAELAVAAVAAVPLGADPALGTIELHHGVPRVWTDHEIDAVCVFAELAAGHLARVRELERQQALAAQLQTALDSRVVTEQAKGVLAAEFGIGTSEAFELLRRSAREQGRKLRDLAEAVVNGGWRPEPPGVSGPPSAARRPRRGGR